MKIHRARRGLVIFFQMQAVFIGTVVAGMVLSIVPAMAQTTNMAELRELRVECLESFNTAKTRLDELHGFVGQQAGRERAAANELFELKQSAASARQRNGELQRQVREYTNLLAKARSATEQATASYRAAVEAMPSGESWAAEGSAALNELRRAADASPRDMWKHKRVKEIQAEFVDTLHEWRAARRSMEQASFDLELRAAPSAFERVAGQLKSVSAELTSLETQLAERQTALGKLSEKSEQWAAAIRALSEGETQARDQLAKAGFKFHLVDLKFTAWRMKHSNLGDEGFEALPDVLEESLVNEPKRPGYVTSLPPGSTHGEGIASAAAPSEAAAKEEKEEVEQGDAAFRDLLARVNLAQGRLRFLASVLQAEFTTVQAAIGALEKVEDQARELADATGRLAADQESLRRALETEQQALAKGAETLDLVKKRFAADLKVINELLEKAAKQTEKLAKGLGNSR